MSPPTKLLVLGIDAANPDLVRRWAGDGTMPNLAALMARGLVAQTRGVEGFLVGATWPSLYTGVTAARHGFHYQVQLKPGTYEYHHARVKREPFWTTLSRAGKRLAIVDVPLTELDPNINGMHLVDWSGIEALSAFRAAPAGIQEEVAARWGLYPLKYSCEGLRQTLEEFRSFIDELLQGVEMRADLTSHFLAKGGWDLFMQVFTESHCAGHLVWHLHDPTNPAHDPGLAARLGDPLRQVYAAIDRGLGQILEAAGDGPVIVFGAHGMSYWYGAQFVLKEILFRLGASAPLADRPGRGPIGEAVRAIRRWVPQSVRDTMRPRRRLPPRIEALPPLPQLDVDPRRSKCFVVPNGHLTGAIRLNLAGREPHGVLRPGAEADDFCLALARDLLQIVDERTGRPVIRRVTRTSDAFRGEFVSSLPDLLVDWDDEAPTGSSHHAGGADATVRLHSPGIGSLEGTNQYHRTGDHRIGGIFVAAGGGIRPGTLHRTISTLDIAPTLAALLGETLTGVDGEVIPEVVAQG